MVAWPSVTEEKPSGVDLHSTSSFQSDYNERIDLHRTSSFHMCTPDCAPECAFQVVHCIHGPVQCMHYSRLNSAFTSLYDPGIDGRSDVWLREQHKWAAVAHCP